MRLSGATPVFALLACILSTGRRDAGSVHEQTDGVVLHLDSMSVRLMVCDARTLRVTVVPGWTFSSRASLVVIRKWGRVPWRLRRQDSTLVVSTGQIAARINRRTGAIAFKDIHGIPIVREDPAQPHQLFPATVACEQTFHLLQRFRLDPDEALYGLGQFEGGIMNYRNHDVTLIQNNRHVCVPMLLSSRRYGILWDNYSHTEFHDGPDGMSLWSEVGDGIDYYVMYGKDLDDVIAAYRHATGEVPMFPRWAFGYWQSKERYENQEQVMSVAREYRRRHLPIDNIVQDWQYWGRRGWNAMAFDDSLYPDPKGMIDSLHRLYNFHLMISIWPQVDPSTAVYRDLKARGHLYPTEVWNGGRTYDAYSREARKIYWEYLNAGLFRLGVDAWWVDATEPDWKWCDSLLEEKKGIVMNGPTALGSSSRYLNSYALMTTAGIYEHQRQTDPNRRVVMLIRSAFAGQQRNSMAVWSGDISSDWETFRNQIPAGVNFCMAGIPYWNSDIGGFLPKEYGGEYPLGARDPAYRELHVRWFEFAAFCPIFRAHGTDFPREIWQFGEPGSWAYNALAKYDSLRYRLLPYVYSVAWKVTHDGSTMMRGLPMDFLPDRRSLNQPGEYMFGPAFLVVPVTSSIYYPKNPGVVIPPSNLHTQENVPGLAGQYFKGKDFDHLERTTTDSCINFEWTNEGPGGVGKADYSVRWSGKVRSREAGKYEFEVISDDGVNLWVDNRQLMDEMYPAGRQINIGEIVLGADRWYDIKLEYQQIDAGVEVRLTWRTPAMLAAYQPRRGVGSMRLYLPAPANWTDFWTGESFAGGKEVEREVPLDIMPLYVRGGSIVSLGPVVQYSTEEPADPLELRIYPGEDGSILLYEDENDGYRYERGVYATISMHWDDRSRTLTIGKRRGSFPGMLTTRTINAVMVRPGHGTGIGQSALPDRTITYSGKQIAVVLPGDHGN